MLIVLGILTTTALAVLAGWLHGSGGRNQASGTCFTASGAAALVTAFTARGHSTTLGLLIAVVVTLALAGGAWGGRWLEQRRPMR